MATLQQIETKLRAPLCLNNIPFSAKAQCPGTGTKSGRGLRSQVNIYKIQNSVYYSFWEGALFLKLPHVAVTLCCLLLLCVQVNVISCSYEYSIGVSEFFLGFICNCLSYFITARITFIIILYLQCTHMIFIIYASCHLLCVQCGFSQGTV